MDSLKASELRIGSYYKSPHVHFEGSIRAKINPDSEDVFILTPKALIVILQHNMIEWVEPIPLTEDWLIRLGFEVRENNSKDRYWKDDYLYSEGGLFLHFSMDEGDKWVSCKYVHQLQNLFFALTGEELEVKESARP